ncbi:MAG TPA: M28 family peptidase [Candidatus Acidoferrales bacterium]|nr:M28 family peptidase [Candidatus Acidoferrales bacterium]
MTRILMCAGLLLADAITVAQTRAPAPQLQQIVREVRRQVRASEAFDFVARLHSIDRWQDFSKFRQSAEYLQGKMSELGLRDVELLPAPADGVSQFGWWTMPLAWDVKTATLEVVEPAAPAAMRVLCDYSQEPASLIQWSGSTAPGGLTAEVMQVRSGRLAELKSADVRGKMILIEVPADLSERGAMKAALYKMGAAGVISDYTENEDLRDGHYWVNAWGDMGWGYTKASSPLVGFSITPRQGQYLRGLLDRGTKVRVHAVVDARYYPGSYYSVTGVIPGSGSDEEVLELGHGFELGAQDNSTGQAGMLEAIAAIGRAIDAGRLPRPKRSIRMLTFSEDYGSSHYISTHMDRMKRTVGAIHLDVPAGNHDVLGAYSFGATPDVARTYHNALVMRVAESFYAGAQAEGGGGRSRVPLLVPYSPTSDTYPSEPMIGVPTIAVRGSSGLVAVHHNSEDTLDRVDPKSLEDLSCLVGAYLYYLARADEDDVPWLAGITLEHSNENALRALAPYFDRILAAQNAEALGRELYWGLAKTGYNADRDEAAILSILRLAAPANTAKVRTLLEPALASARRVAEEQSARLRQAANVRAAELTATVPVNATAPPIDPRRAEAARIIVRRKRFGPVTLDDLPVDQREGFPGFAAQPAPLRLIYWCDGKRTVAEVIHLIELEQGPMDFDFVGYYKMLAKHGYVDLIPSAKVNDNDRRLDAREPD